MEEYRKCARLGKDFTASSDTTFSFNIRIGELSLHLQKTYCNERSNLPRNLFKSLTRKLN